MSSSAQPEHPAAADPVGAGPAAAGAAEPRRPGSARRLFATTVLVCEAFVVFFAALAAFGLRLAEPALVFGTGAALAVLCAGAAALLRRGLPGYLLGTAVQVLLLLGGLVIDTMVVLGVVFAILWAVAWQVGGRIDDERQERYRTELARYRAGT